MTPRNTSYRKFGYVAAIVFLLIPLSWISMPASGGDQQRAGGKLARLRKQYGLAQSNLGDIDPTSEAMKLATIGARGLAANLLWHKATHYKKTEDWTNLSATLNQITKLQPHFLKVWQFQAWNLSYNVSVQFDDYHDRYAWVLRGINFLKGGLRYNADEPRMLWDLGWFTGHKIGRADEKVQYRRLFQRDDDFHAGSGRTLEQRDNWLVGKEFFDQTIDAVVIKGRRMRGKSELLYHSDPAMAQIYYASALEEDGIFGDDARKAWLLAGQDWQAYGDQDVLTSQGRRIQLSKFEHWLEQRNHFRSQLDNLVPGTVDALRQEREQALTPTERESLALPPELRTMEQHQIADGAAARMVITNMELASRVVLERPESEIEAMRLARLADEAEDRSELIARYRSIVNYDYWKRRCEFEQTPQAVAAHRLVHEGEQDFDLGRTEAALEKYEAAFQKWREVYDMFPDLEYDDLTGEDLAIVVRQYVRVLDQYNLLLPADFILRDVVEAHDPNGEFAALFAEGDARQAAGSDSPAPDPAEDGPLPDEPSQDEPPQPISPGPPEPAAEAAE